MMDLLSIRRIEDRDWPGILRVQQACYGAPLLESEAALRSKAAASPATCFIASTAAKQIAAYILAHPYPRGQWPALDRPVSPHAPDGNLWLHDMAVHPDFAGQGLGTALLRAVERRAQARGFSTISLIAVQAAADYWRRFGFAPPVADLQEGETPAAEPPGADLQAKGYGPGAVLMEKRLRP